MMVISLSLTTHTYTCAYTSVYVYVSIHLHIDYHIFLFSVKLQSHTGFCRSCPKGLVTFLLKTEKKIIAGFSRLRDMKTTHYAESRSLDGQKQHEIISFFPSSSILLGHFRLLALVMKLEVKMVMGNKSAINAVSHALMIVMMMVKVITKRLIMEIILATFKVNIILRLITTIMRIMATIKIALIIALVPLNVILTTITIPITTINANKSNIKHSSNQRVD